MQGVDGEYEASQAEDDTEELAATCAGAHLPVAMIPLKGMQLKFTPWFHFRLQTMSQSTFQKFLIDLVIFGNDYMQVIAT